MRLDSEQAARVALIIVSVLMVGYMLALCAGDVAGALVGLIGSAR